MTTSDSSIHTAQARESLRQLAHSSHRIDDPGELYDLLGDLSLALTSKALNDGQWAIQVAARRRDSRLTEVGRHEHLRRTRSRPLRQRGFIAR